MSFIRFTKFVINPAWIQSIETMPSGYKIMMSQPVMSGFMLFSTGFADSMNKPIWINKEKEPTDYEKMTKWMENHSS